MSADTGEKRGVSVLDIARRGLAHHRADRLAEAGRLYRLTLALAPDFAEVWSNLGAVLVIERATREAERALNRAARLQPGHPLALNNLGLALMDQGRHAEAAAVLEGLLERAPHDVRAMNNLGMVRLRQGDEAAALVEFANAVAIDPAYDEARLNLGVNLRLQGALTPAIGHLRVALDLAPDKPDRWADLANGLALAGRHVEARDALFADVDWNGAKPENHSVRLFTLNYLGDVPAGEIARLHIEAGRRLEAVTPRVVRPPAQPIAGRPLRVGYVSPDFRFHPVGRFLLPLIEAHDPSEVQVFCYAESASLDELGRRFQARAHTWRGTVGVSHEALAAQIVADGIDVLVDLAGHTANHRLPVFAAKPTPVQVSWLGYANTTGLSTIDYRITDAIADPPGVADTLHSERLVRLPGGFLCFAPPDTAPPVGPLPARTNGFVTFGSFNTLGKLTPAVVALWGRLLAALPGSRLVVKAGGLSDAPSRRRLTAALRAAGAPAGALTIVGGLADYNDHLAAYRIIDIALDPFPYNGTTTTCEALHMGVPVVTLAGDRHAARVGASLLARVDLGHLAAPDEAGYLAAALGLARDPGGLAELRAGLRERLSRSPLCDPRRLAREMEAAYRAMVAASGHQGNSAGAAHGS